MSHTVIHLDDVDRVPSEGADWRPLRRALGVTAFGINAYTSRAAGEQLIESHDETSIGAGGHEEVYAVISGEATFTVDGEEIPAPAGTLIRVDPGTRRAATAATPDTTVLIVGGRPGAGLPVSAFEYWYAAQPAYEAGDYERAVAIASEGLTEWPEHPSLHYQLACYEALAGHRERALYHLQIAYAGHPPTREWAAGDSDLESVRDDPSLG